MKKIILIFISTLVMIFIFILCMVNNDDRYIDNIKNNILDNTDIKDINYINEYDNYFIVEDSINLYLINSIYDIIFKIDKELIHINDKEYEIIYKDKTIMYFHDRIDGNRNIYEYYDLYTYELIDRVIID